MAGRSVTRFKEPRELFPADNALACKVLQLCVLREDLFLEPLLSLTLMASSSSLRHPSHLSGFHIEEIRRHARAGC